MSGVISAVRLGEHAAVLCWAVCRSQLDKPGAYCELTARVSIYARPASRLYPMMALLGIISQGLGLRVYELHPNTCTIGAEIPRHEKTVGV